MRTFRILTWLGIAVFWTYVLLPKFTILSEVFIALVFTVGTLIMVQGLQVLFYLLRESDESLENQDKLYKALGRLEDIENC